MCQKSSVYRIKLWDPDMQMLLIVRVLTADQSVNAL